MKKQEVNKIKKLQGFHNIDKNKPVYNQIIDSIYKEMIAKINDPNFDAIKYPWQLYYLANSDIFDFKPTLKKITNKYKNEKGHTVFGSSIPNDYKFIYDHDIWSNIHWGYTLQKNKVLGRQLGGQIDDLLKGHPFSYVFSSQNTDNNAVKFGMELYDKYGPNLTKEQFESEIFKNKEKLNRWSKEKLTLLKSKEPEAHDYFNLPQEDRIDLIPDIPFKKDEDNIIINPQSYFYYEVKPDDSLEKIADDNNMSTEELMELNPELEYTRKVIPFQILIVGDKDARNLSVDAFQIDSIKNAKLVMRHIGYSNSDNPNSNKVNDDISQFFHFAYSDENKECNITDTSDTTTKTKEKETKLMQDAMLFRKLHKKVEEQKPNSDIKQEVKIFNEYKIPEIKHEEIANDIFTYAVITENPDMVAKTTQTITNQFLNSDDELLIDGIIGEKTISAINSLDEPEAEIVDEKLNDIFEQEIKENHSIKNKNSLYNFDGDDNLLYCPVPDGFYD
ncbi:MAG: LysM peptidoglycan-binding domain-containing protein [Alphaproteobacteria bacterium]